MANTNQIEQQHRVVVQMKNGVTRLMEIGAEMRSLLYTHDRLGMGTPDDAAFEGTGTDAAAYLQAIWALNQIRDMDEQVFVALETFCR